MTFALAGAAGLVITMVKKKKKRDARHELFSLVGRRVSEPSVLSYKGAAIWRI
jgi:hypothetical protein